MQSPSFHGYPECDREVKTIADALWGDDENENGVVDHKSGEGHVFWGISFEQIFERIGLKPDFEQNLSDAEALRYIHRRNQDADWYFVSNPSRKSVDAVCCFRVSGKRPELWNPETGERIHPSVYQEQNGSTTLPIHFQQAQSYFVVFRNSPSTDAIRSVKRDGRMIQPSAYLNGRLVAESVKSSHNVHPSGKRGSVAETPIQQWQVIDKALDAKAIAAMSKPEDLTPPWPLPTFDVAAKADGTHVATAWQGGHYELDFASGHVASVKVDAIPKPMTIKGPWSVRFPAGAGAPESIELNELSSWTEHARPGVQHFSGTATYAKRFQVDGNELKSGHKRYLDLGDVRVIAQVRLNGQDLGVLWKAPFRCDVTDILREGENTLQIKVTNLWPNRLIGDERVPPDIRYNARGGPVEWPEWLRQGEENRRSRRITFSSWKHFQATDPLLPSGLIGPVLIHQPAVVSLQ